MIQAANPNGPWRRAAITGGIELTIPEANIGWYLALIAELEGS